MPGGSASPDGQTLAAIEAALRKFNTQLWTFYALAIVITGLRTYARFKAVGIKQFRPDDYIVWVAIVREKLLIILARSIAYS